MPMRTRAWNPLHTPMTRPPSATKALQGRPQRPAAEKCDNLTRAEVVAEREASGEGEYAGALETTGIDDEIRYMQPLGSSPGEPQSLGELGVALNP